jgi:branched-chain amino acid transport system substrate-binding protein
VGANRRIAWLMGLAVLLVAACGGNSNAPAATSSVPFNVLSIAAITGANGASGLAFLQGMKAAAIVVNKEGGILGHQVAVQALDPQGNATTAVSMLNQSIDSGPSSGSWNLCACGGTSDENLAENPVAGKAKLVSITQGGAAQLNDPKTFPYHFNDGSDAALTAKYLAQDVQKLKFTKLALLTEDVAYCQSDISMVGTNLANAGVKYVNQTFSATAVDITPTLLQLKSQGVDQIVWCALGASVGYVLKSRSKIGWDVALMGDLGPASSDDVTLVGGDLSAVKGTSFFAFATDVAGSPISKTSTFKDFQTTLASIVPVITTSLHSYLGGWDAVQAMKLAAEQTKSLDSDKLRSALENLKVPSSSPLLLATNGFGWTAKSHAPVNPPAEFTTVPVGPLRSGQYYPPSS